MWSTNCRMRRSVESCALKVQEALSPEMAIRAKLSQQPCTESCVVHGNMHGEA